MKENQNKTKYDLKADNFNHTYVSIKRMFTKYFQKTYFLFFKETSGLARSYSGEGVRSKPKDLNFRLAVGYLSIILVIKNLL